MGLYNSLTPKRHIGWSNADAIGRLDLGKLCRRKKKDLALNGTGTKSTRTYVSGGKKRYAGTTHLRSTGSDPYTFGGTTFLEQLKQ